MTRATNSRHEISAECACGHIQWIDRPATEQSIYCSECARFITRYVPRHDAPRASSPATDGGASEQGCSPAGSRTVAPPAAVRDEGGIGVPPSKPARLDFEQCAKAAIDAVTNLHACINQNRSRLTIAQVATVKDQLRLIHHTIRLWGLRDASRPDDLPGSRPHASSLKPRASQEVLS